MCMPRKACPHAVLVAAQHTRRTPVRCTCGTTYASTATHLQRQRRLRLLADLVPQHQLVGQDLEVLSHGDGLRSEM